MRGQQASAGGLATAPMQPLLRFLLLKKRSEPFGADMPKRKGKSNKQGRKQPRNRQRPAGATRQLLATTIPRSAIEVKGHAHGMRIKGTEIVAEANSSVLAARQIRTLNPLVAGVFPKLTGYALQWERYRFLRVGLRYVPACPATQSGAIGIAVHTTYLGSLSQVSVNMPEFASFEYAAAGTVAGPLSAPVWRTVDPEWFFVSTEVTSDPLKTNQGSISWLTRDASSADNGKLAGYVVIDYDIEFANNRPTQNRVAVTVNDAPQEVKGGDVSLIDLGSFTNEIGDWLLDKWYDAGGPDSTRSTWSDLAAGGTQYVLDWAFDVGGVTVESKAPTARWHRCPTVPVWESYHPSLAKRRPGRVTHDDAKELFGDPATAGDITVTIQLANNTQGTSANLYNQAFSPGTGATSLTGMLEFSIDDGVLAGVDEGDEIQLAVKVFPTGSEVRLISDLVTCLAPVFKGFD